MTLDSPRLTRTSAATVTGDRTEVTTSADRSLVRAAVRLARTGRLMRDGLRAGWAWTAHTVRPAGALVLAAASVGLVVGVVLGWVEWIVAGVLALVLVALAVPFLFGTRAYAVQLSLAHRRIVAGSGADAAVVVRNAGVRVALPGRIDVPVGDGLVEFAVPLLRAGHDSPQTLEIPPQPRGIVRVGPAVTVRTDPLGLLRREHAFDDVHDLYVHPVTVALPTMSAGLIRDLDGRPTRRLVDADMSFHAIREYAPGDARRQVHWKSTAKTGRLMVRQYEESRRSHIAVVLGLAETEYADGDEFELAVSAAASLARRAVQDARGLEIVVGAEIPRVVRGRLRAIRRLPAGSVRAVLDGFSGVDRLADTMAIEEVCTLTAESEERVSIAAIVTGSTTALDRLRRAALAFPPDTLVVAVVCDRRAHPRTRVSGAMTVHTIGTLDDLAGLVLRTATG